MPTASIPSDLNFFEQLQHKLRAPGFWYKGGWKGTSSQGKAALCLMGQAMQVAAETFKGTTDAEPGFYETVFHGQRDAVNIGYGNTYALFLAVARSFGPRTGSIASTVNALIMWGEDPYAQYRKEYAAYYEGLKNDEEGLDADVASRQRQKFQTMFESCIRFNDHPETGFADIRKVIESALLHPAEPNLAKALLGDDQRPNANPNYGL